MAFASHLSARKSSDRVAIAVARACGHAAATVHVPSHAPQAINYILKAVSYFGGDVKNEQDWQLKHLLELYYNKENYKKSGNIL